MANVERITAASPDLYLSQVDQNLPAVWLLNIHLINSGRDEALNWLCDRLECGTPARIAFLNAHCANISARDADYRKALESAHAVLADGSGIALALRLKGHRLAANLNGTDLIPALCKRIANSRHSVFLLGGKPGIAEAAADALKSIAPGLKIAGTHHGFFGETGEAAVINAINASRADIVLVAMGVPSQDLWLHRNAARMSATLTFGVGGLFDFLSGRIPRAPLWLRKAGLEWTYRLYQEPGRMWRRYVLGNPEFVARAAVDALPNRSEFVARFDLAAKRVIGFTTAALGLFLLSPLLMSVALAIRLTSKGPAILRQKRIGKDGVPFQLYKFRSMYIDADERRAALLAENHHGADCVTFKLANDPRITPLGRFLRRSSIDELPQLFNVLEGSMALVGPRPPLPEEVSRYTPDQRRRLAGKPGLTCLWQVSGRANLPFPKQVELDIEYLTHRNVLMDTMIVLRTIPAVLFARGAY
jgi:exopolysaccharide biosynthesis WecB/TagA/CpsF family protein